MEKQEPQVIKIKTNKLAHNYQSYSIMSVSLDGDRIPRKKKKRKLSETSLIGNKITQDPDNMSKEAKVGISIEGSYSENPLSKDKEKDMALNKLPSLDKYRSSSKTETENTLKLDTRKISLPLSSSDDKSIKNMNHK